MDIKFGDDIEIVNGDIATVDEPQASGQRIRHRLLTFRGEWFLDLLFGPPYIEQVFVKNPRVDLIGAVIRGEILKSASGQFTSFSATLNNAARRLSMEFALETPQGNVAANITV